jgi:lysophospholipase L1-like esterase
MSLDSYAPSYYSRILQALPTYQKTVREMAKKYKTYFVDFHPMFQRYLAVMPRERFCPEPFHPSATGHLLMAYEWLRVMKF